MRRRPRLMRARLRELLHYDAESGEFRWRKNLRNRVRLGDRAGCSNEQRRSRGIKIDGRVYREHQLAWFYMTGRWGRPGIDHRDGDVTNNRWNNLRRATHSQNSANRRRPRHNTSGFKGVGRCRRSGKWLAFIGNKGRMIYLGGYATPQEAHAAYVAAARKLFGEFARAE